MKNRVLKLIIILNIVNKMIFAENQESSNIKGFNNEVSHTKESLSNQTLFDDLGPILLQDNYGRFHPILIAATLGLAFNFPRKVKIPLSVMYAMIYQMDNENKIGKYIGSQFQKNMKRLSKVYEELDKSIENLVNEEE